MTTNIAVQLGLPLTEDSEVNPPGVSVRTAIEDEDFPFEKFFALAELESWRKEINRPIYHIHKWWAKRLGSVVRAMVIGALTPGNGDVMANFYRSTSFPDSVVFDPFMGSGTTVGEALKLGCRAIGRDINPVAYFTAKNALTPQRREEVLATFQRIEETVAPQIREYYQATLPDQRFTDTLYYFWVTQAPCPACSRDVDLFRSYVFAGHANRNRHNWAHALCPQCGSINPVEPKARSLTCGSCRHHFNPQQGPGTSRSAVCPDCHRRFVIAEAIRQTGNPPEHRLYAKLVVDASGKRLYLPADDFDQSLYHAASQALQDMGTDFLAGDLQPGHNTNQAINYGYRRWQDMFNNRQLLSLRLLADEIRSIDSAPLRDLFSCLFSGILDFNNMFASYKGEGTGAVRHMFAHHILKPARTPLEANPWGTPYSSGSFSTLFKSRVLRALEYQGNPFELAVTSKNGRRSGKKIYGLSEPLVHTPLKSFAEFDPGGRLYLSCGDSASTDLDDRSVDVVITDPPFFDFVHYSELADFFYVWQQYILDPESTAPNTTRSALEVQSDDIETFVIRLGEVWIECERVLKPNGLLVFSFHHSRPEGWSSLLRALQMAEFSIVAAHPIKSEMSVGAPKAQAKDPITLDMILVCRRKLETNFRIRTTEEALEQANAVVREQVQRLDAAGHVIAASDLKVIQSAQAIRFLSACNDGIAADLENTITRAATGRIP